MMASTWQNQERERKKEGMKKAVKSYFLLTWNLTESTVPISVNYVRVFLVMGFNRKKLYLTKPNYLD